ncbi:MAG TPA: leucyl/phenylalanyl-tRNA--protein transferase [Phycisphaerales bacterium]|nr:leucyl/phenylalanyl-tRNA--protein transferase [Phycisphaerales bacterium]
MVRDKNEPEEQADDAPDARTEGEDGAEVLDLEVPEGIDPNKPSAELLLWAYRNGIFPMGDPDSGELGWYQPDPRGVLPLDDFHAPKSLMRKVRTGVFDIRMDTRFEDVMRECAKLRPKSEGTWITNAIVQAYVQLFERGHAHSVEAWRDGKLVGGLYGVHIGGAFFGESMFSRPALGGTDSSKVCLVHLVQHMKSRGMTLLDTQFKNPHLAQFNCVEIPRAVYEKRLREAVRLDIKW